MRILAALLVLCTIAGCSRRPLTYEEEIASWHAEKDQFMRESSESPVPADKRATFPALAYFPTDPAYRTGAELAAVQGGPTLDMPTSTGQLRKMRRVGTLAFTLKGQPMTLTAFVEADQNDMRRLFVPFGDLTNGTETYPGGRYLDLDRTATGIYDIDFNRAYHPFCFYNPTYDCPYPPAENRLKMPIRAGERLPKANR
ncbi:MAG TPA: DUF1684 domain-containing protein [Vicinamibacterales bacterium]